MYDFIIKTYQNYYLSCFSSLVINVGSFALLENLKRVPIKYLYIITILYKINQECSIGPLKSRVVLTVRITEENNHNVKRFMDV